MTNKKDLDPNELLPFCMRCFNVGLTAEDDKSNYCHMCGGGGTCINVKRSGIHYMQENMQHRIDMAVEHGRKNADYTEDDCRKDTIQHINQVKEYMIESSTELLKRANEHDRSKLESPELETFTEFTPKLQKSTYLSEEYKQNLAGMKVGLDHHYAHNSHHPEHYKKFVCDHCFAEYKETEPGSCQQCMNTQFTQESDISQMDLFDLVEMICDWMAAVKRHDDGDIIKSLKGNKERFKIDDQLYSILMQTVLNMENR